VSVGPLRDNKVGGFQGGYKKNETGVQMYRGARKYFLGRQGNLNKEGSVLRYTLSEGKIPGVVQYNKKKRSGKNQKISRKNNKKEGWKKTHGKKFS